MAILVTEIAYIGRDNRIDLILLADKNDGNGMQPQALDAVTKMDLLVLDVTVTSDNQEGDPIRWAQAGWDTGEVRLLLGLIDPDTISPCRCDAPLIVYDPSNPNGLVWEHVPLLLKAAKSE